MRSVYRYFETKDDLVLAATSAYWTKMYDTIDEILKPVIEQDITGYEMFKIIVGSMDGLEATRNIRALQKSDAAIVPIIALTAQALEIDAEKCAAAGMNGHVAKPIDPDELLAVIEKAVGVSRKR